MMPQQRPPAAPRTPPVMRFGMINRMATKPPVAPSYRPCRGCRAVQSVITKWLRR